MKKRAFLSVVLGIMMSTACALQSKENQLLGNWVEVMPANPQFVQGISLSEDGKASSIGMATLKYEAWKVDGDKLILKGKSIGNHQEIEFSDELDIVELKTNTLTLGKFGAYRAHYYRVDEVPDLENLSNLPKLLPKPEGSAVLLTKVYEGLLPAASGVGIVYKITLYNYENSGDGVFKAQLTYLEADNGKDKVFEFGGRQFTLRGRGGDDNATVLQLRAFNNAHDVMNFEQKGSSLTLLDKDLKPIKSKLNYTLKLQ